MTEQPTYVSGYRNGRTEATLAGIAEKLDELHEDFKNCSKGKVHDNEICHLWWGLYLLSGAILATHPEQVIWLIKQCIGG